MVPVVAGDKSSGSAQFEDKKKEGAALSAPGTNLVTIQNNNKKGYIDFVKNSIAS